MDDNVSDSEVLFWEAYESRVKSLKSGDRTEAKRALLAMWKATILEIEQCNMDISLKDWFRNVLGELVDGNLPDEIQSLDLKQSDLRRNDGPRDEAIKYAVAYRQAVENGFIDDPFPKKRIKSAFGVDGRTIRHWLENEDYASNLWTHFTDRFQNKAGERLRKRMIAMGHVYRNLSRVRNKNRSKTDT